MTNSTDSQAKGHAQTLSNLNHEAANALAEALDLCFEAEDKWRALFSTSLQDYNTMRKDIMYEFGIRNKMQM